MFDILIPALIYISMGGVVLGCVFLFLAIIFPIPWIVPVAFYLALGSTTFGLILMMVLILFD